MNGETLNILLSLPVYVLWFGPIALGLVLAIRHATTPQQRTERADQPALAADH